MSRIGKQLITVPEGVAVTIDKQLVSAKGPNGELSLTLPEGITIEQTANIIAIKRLSESKTVRSLHGLYRVLTTNLLTGVKDGFTKTLEFKGIGYRVAVNNDILTLNTGYSHPVELTIPAGIKVEVKKTTISVSGNDKSQVGQFAAIVRAVRKPEVYKGKGIRYSDEHIKIKPGKTAAKG
jgi:large subunit ribosomal protein L6